MIFCRVISIVLIMFSGLLCAQQEVVGKWKTIDDSTGEPKSIVSIYKEGNQVFGKIEDILDKERKNDLCEVCEGEDYNKPVQGMIIIKNLVKDGEEYIDGTVLDPENGKVYRCKIWVDGDNPNVLNVRGYISFLFRTQQWIKA